MEAVCVLLWNVKAPQIIFRLGYGSCVCFCEIQHPHLRIQWLAFRRDRVGGMWLWTIYGPWVAGSSEPFFATTPTNQPGERANSGSWNFQLETQSWKAFLITAQIFLGKKVSKQSAKQWLWSKSPHIDSQQFFAAAARILQEEWFHRIVIQ